MAMNEQPEDGPSRLELPAFVTHGPKGNEAKYISTLYALARSLDDELCSEQAWVAKRLLPFGDEVQPGDGKSQNTNRIKKARAKRIERLRYQVSTYCQRALNGSAASASPSRLEQSATDFSSSFVMVENHSFGSGELQLREPSLASVIGPDPVALDSEHLAKQLETMLDGFTRPDKMIGSMISLGSFSCASSPASMELDQALPFLDELSELEAIASQLQAADFDSFETKLQSVDSTAFCHLPPPRPGSVLTHTMLPTPVANMLKELMKPTLNPGTRSLTMLQELGVLAVGFVGVEDHERVLFMPGAPESRRLDMKKKLRIMMAEYECEQEERNEVAKPGCTALVVYFDTEEGVEPTPEVGKVLNTNFALIMLSQARDKGILLEATHMQMLEDHERRRDKLELAEDTLARSYELVGSSASWMSSLGVSLNPSTPAGSRQLPTSNVCPQPSTTTSLLEVMASTLQEGEISPSYPWQGTTSEVLGPPSETTSLREENAGALKLTKQPQLLSVPTPPPVQPKTRALAAGPTRDVDDEDEEGYTMLARQPVARQMETKRSAPPLPRRIEDSRSTGDAFEELTYPHAPSTQLVAELDGLRHHTRSRLPAPSSAMALNEHLKRVGAEIDGEQPFEIIGENIEDDEEKPILDKVIKEHHDEHHRYEKWAGVAHERWVEYLHGGRLLLNDETITTVQECMTNGQKLEFTGSTDGCPYGVIALHVHGSGTSANRKRVAEVLVKWLLDVGDAFVFYGKMLRDWVRWDHVAPNVQTWDELMAYLRDSFAYLEYTAADWLLYVAVSHVFGPVLIFSGRLSRAMRFVASDARRSEHPTDSEIANLNLRGYVDAAQLPAWSETWLRLGMLENGHFVRCRSKQLKSELMLQMCNARDAELQKQLSVEVPHAVIFQGPSKAGKSTIMNALARKVLYDSAPPTPKKGEKKGSKVQPELAVLGAPVPGSEIGRGMESETLLVNSMVIHTNDDDTPKLQLLDTPGMFDSRGPLIEVVNAVSIAKCMARFKSLRIVVMVREEALNGTGEGFANTAEAMSKLFSMNGGGSASAKKNVLLWINPHKPEVDYGEKGIIEEIKKMNAARPEIRDFLRMIEGQYSSRKVVHMLEYTPETAQGDEREKIVRARRQRYPDSDPDAPVTKAVFDIDGLIMQLVNLNPMQNPAEKCGLPLTEKAIAEIVRQANELHDYVSLRSELHDYRSLLKYLDVLQALCTHMQAGSRSTQGQNRFDSTYQTSLATVTERLQSVCGKIRMETLCLPIEQPVAFKATDLNDICFAMRAAAAAAVLEPHLSRLLGSSWKELGVETCCGIVAKQVQSASEVSRKLLCDHFITGSSGLQAAYNVFGQQIKLMLNKLQQMKEYFSLEAEVNAELTLEASANFQRIATEAGKNLDLLYKTLHQAVDTQTKAAAAHITRGLDEAARAVSQYLKSLCIKNDSALDLVSSAAPSVSPFDAAANALDVIKTAEESLVGLVEEIRGAYSSSRSHVISVVEKKCQETCSLIEQVKVDACTRQPLAEELELMLASLLFLLHSRSSSLRKHCTSGGMSDGAIDALARLDACYEEPVAKVVEWHAELVKGVLEGAKRSNDFNFVKNLSDFRSHVELSTELAKLAAVEKIQSDQRATRPCPKWGALQASANDLSRKIEVALQTFGNSVSSRLHEHSVTINNAHLDVVESYDYKEHARDLLVLENARWCDAILAEPTIEAAILNVWQAFEKHMKRLAKGEDGAIELLHKGNYKDARTLLVQIHGMEVLFDEALVADVEVAQRVKEMHDEAHKVANDVIATKCDEARTRVLERPCPTGKRERWDWWMVIGVQDANFTDALWHLNSLLDLANWLITASKGHNRLRGWLDLERLEKVHIDCANRAKALIHRLHSRVQSFFAAVGSCRSQAIDAAVLELTGDQMCDQICATAEMGSMGSEGTASDELSGMKSAKVACREVKDILMLLSRPGTYSALFAAAAHGEAGSDFTAAHGIHDLERLFQATYMECQINFGDEETEPVARQGALNIYLEFDRSLPFEKIFEGFKKTFQSHYQLLVSAHQQAKKGEKNALHAAFASYEFNEDTYRMMDNLRKSKVADPKSRVAYDEACSKLSGSVRSLLEYVSMNFSHLKHSDQSFRAQDHLVKPWNQLQAARTHVEFLNEVPGSTQISLDGELAQMVQRFEAVFKDEVLQPFAKMFDMGDYLKAEGDTAFGLKRVHILTSQIQAHGGQLGQIAKAALNEERERQKLALQSLHLLPFERKFELPQDEEDTTFLNERLRVVHGFLIKSFERIAQLCQCKGDFVLVLEYKAAHDNILKEVGSFLQSEFGPLFRDDYLNMRMMHVKYLEQVLDQMGIGGYAPDAAKLLNCSLAKSNIEMFLKLTDHQDQESFSSVSPGQQAEIIRRTSPQSKSYVTIVQEFGVAHKNAVQRADSLLRKASSASEVLPGELEEVFAEVRTRAECAHELKGIKLDRKVVADLEVTLRTCRANLEGWLTTNQQSPLLFSSGDPSTSAVRDTQLLRTIHTYKSLVKLAPVKTHLSSGAMHSPPAAPPVTKEPMVDKPIDEDGPVSHEGGFSSILMGGVKDVVSRMGGVLGGDFLQGNHGSAGQTRANKNQAKEMKNPSAAAALTPDALEVCPNEAVASSPAGSDSSPQLRSYPYSSPAGSTQRSSADGFTTGPRSAGAQVMELLRAKLNETVKQWADAPEAAQHIGLKHQALLRLQRWEPDENAGNGPTGPVSIFDAAAELEVALIEEGALAASQQVTIRPVPHDVRVSKTCDEIMQLLFKAKASIEFVAQFDPDGNQPPIDPKPFEMIFSREMAELCQLVDHRFMHDIESLKEEVAKWAQGILSDVTKLLAERKNKIADRCLRTWTYLEPLTLLGALKHLPGSAAFDAQLQAHASKLGQLAKMAVQSSDKKDGWEKAVTMPLLHLAKFGSDISRAAAFSNEALAEALSAAEAKFGAHGMQTLAAELREREPALGNEVISSSDAFIAVAVADFNQKTQRDISVVKQLYAEKNKDAENSVWRKYDEFEREYNRLLRHCTDGLEHMDDPLAFLVEQAKKKAREDKGIIYESQEHIPKVLAAIFAWWSIDFLEKLRKRHPHLKAEPKKLRRANNGQVVCILRLLGCSAEYTGIGSKFKNHLAEVPTGEGKSVVIGVLATTLALYGFHVDCVCYSSMLSSRDRDDFMQLFKAFGLTDRIRYGTFDTLCEELLTEQYGDLRQAARDFITTGKSTRSALAAPPKRALVIDEVDVFCSEAFFGGAYCPALTLQNDEIAELMKHIWASRSAVQPGMDQAFDLSAIQQHPTYQAVLNSGILADGNEWLLERAVREMDKAARAYSPNVREHIVRGGKILYKIEGRDEYGPWAFDYETNAEYLAAYDSGNLDLQQLKEGLCIYVRCGEFSFAALPSMFEHILGVTGTLDSERLPPQMHEVLKTEIKIEKFTYCPSMYHAQKRDFKPDNPAYVQLAKDVDEHYNLIVDEIDSRLSPTIEMEGQRSVIVFFASAEELHKFRDSSYFGKFRDKAKVLTELTASRRDDRDNIIRAATRQGAVTLASRMYGRGTDFKIFDDRVEKAGGMHVLQTFFSRDLSEEEQIKGRCARQGNKGSYSLVLLSASAAKDFDLTIETVQGWQPAEVYAKLSQLRANSGTAEVKSLREMAAMRLKEHGMLADSLQNFHAGKNKGAFGKLMKRYNLPGGMAVGPNGMHVIFCLDESGSMSWCLPFQRSPWNELMDAVAVFWNQSADQPGPPMFVSVVQFGSDARVTQQMVPLQGKVPKLEPNWSGTSFLPAVEAAANLVNNVAGPANGYTAVVIFMSDGAASDSAPAARVLGSLAQTHGNQFSSYTVGFGSSAPRTLEQMAFANGVLEKNNYRAASVGNLAEAFSAVAKSIAPGRL